MKVEIRVAEKDHLREDQPLEEKSLAAGSYDVAIDIAQVLAANQALLKNVSLKMMDLERKIMSLESNLDRHHQAITANLVETRLLAAPKVEVHPWRPDAEELNEAYFNRFSWFDQWFRPERMRRRQTD